LRCLFGGVLDLTGCGLARPVIFAVPHGPARHEKWPTGPCLGRRPGPQADAARPAGHGVPPWPDSHRAGPARDRAVPGRAGPMPRYASSRNDISGPKWAVGTMEMIQRASVNRQAEMAGSRKLVAKLVKEIQELAQDTTVNSNFAESPMLSAKTI